MFAWFLQVLGVASPATPNPESERVAALRRNDAAAWRALMEEYVPRLTAYAQRMVKERSLAEEIVQEAIVAVHAGFANFEGRCSLKSWLYRAVHNKAIDELRRAKRFVEVDEQAEDGAWESRFDQRHWRVPPGQWEGGTGAQIDARRVLDAVDRTLPTLPHLHREVLLMKEVHGLDADEICEALGISAANLRVCLFRARRALRDVVAAEFEGG